MDLSSPSEGSIFDLCLDPAEGEKEEGHRLGKAAIPKKLARRQEFNPDRYNVFTPVSCSSIYKNDYNQDINLARWEMRWK